MRLLGGLEETTRQLVVAIEVRNFLRELLPFFFPSYRFSVLNAVIDRTDSLSNVIMDWFFHELRWRTKREVDPWTRG